MSATIGERSLQMVKFCGFDVSKIDDDVNILQIISFLPVKKGEIIWRRRLIVSGNIFEPHLWFSSMKNGKETRIL